MKSSSRLRFGFQLARLGRRWRRELDARLAAVDLSDATWPPLAHIASAGGVSQKDLAAMTGIETSTLVRVLDVLTARGLVARRQSPSDRRVNLIELTEEGKAAAEGVQALIACAEASMLSRLSDEDVAFMVERFQEIEERLEELWRERETAAEESSEPSE